MTRQRISDDEILDILGPGPSQSGSINHFGESVDETTSSAAAAKSEAERVLFSCSSNQQEWDFSAHRNTRIMRCPFCGQKVRFPTDQGSLILKCPKCRNKWEWGSQSSHLGDERKANRTTRLSLEGQSRPQKVTCSKCGTVQPESKSVGEIDVCVTCGHTARIRYPEPGEENDSSIWAGTIIAVLLLTFMIAVFVSSDNAEYSGSAPSQPVNRYDPDSTSEENRRMIRDQMIKQGVDPVEAEAFTKELYRAEREYRRKHGLPIQY